MLGKHRIRILHIWLSRVFCGIFLYRLERGLYTTIGRAYEYIRVIFIPLFNLMQAYSNLEIHYKADIKGGLLVLHASAGCVVSGLAVIGENLTLTGGNIIGGRAGCKRGDLIIGDNCSLGANAVILGPVRLGNNIEVSASALVVSDCPDDNCMLLGVPAKAIGIVREG
jgi:serine acetyltransferase